MRLFSITVLLFTLFSLNSCTVEPEAIDFGNDQCHYCKMTVVDVQHAAQYVTKKGKQYKFDAIECLINQLKTVDEKTLAFVLVANYSKPGSMLSADSSTFLICPEIKSPMGEYLSAFESKEAAKEIEMKLGGNIYNWQAIKEEINEN